MNYFITEAVGGRANPFRARALALALALAATLASAALAGAALAGPPAGGMDGGGGPAARTERGEASYYGPGLHGRRTASGARFDRRRLTAAHPSLPLGSRVVVTNLANGRRVEVEVNDRGPFARGRAIDLSEAAARRIGITREEGTAPVLIVLAGAG